MTAMSLRWSFRPFEANDEHQSEPGPKVAASLGDGSRVERSWLAGAVDPDVLRGAFGLGKTPRSNP